MIDGTDVDANISKKRAHKKIMEDNEDSLRKNRGKRKNRGGVNRVARENPSMMSDVKSKDKSEGPGGSALGGELDVLTSGYIIEDGNLIPID